MSDLDAPVPGEEELTGVIFDEELPADQDGFYGLDGIIVLVHAAPPPWSVTAIVRFDDLDLVSDV